MRILYLLFFILLAIGGYLWWPVPPQEAVAKRAGTHFSYQVPGRWELKDDVWREGRHRRLQVLEESEDRRARQAERIAEAIESLDKYGPATAARYLSHQHPLRFDRVQADLAELDSVWALVEEARKSLRGAKDEKADPKQVATARALLQQAQQGYEEIAGDLETRSQRLLNDRLMQYALEKTTPTQVDGRPAFLLTASLKRKDNGHLCLLIFEIEQNLVSLCLFDEKPVSPELGENLASSIRIGVEPPPPPLVHDKEKSQPIRLPRHFWSILLVLGAVSLPAAFGAASGYGPSSGPAPDRVASAGAGAFLFTAVGMLLATTGVFIMILSGMADAPTTGGGLMRGIAFVVFFTIFGVCAVISGLGAAFLARWGAKLGARHGRFAAALGAGILATLGAVMGPGLVGWLL